MNRKRVKRVGVVGLVVVLGVVALLGILFVAGIIGVPDGGLEDNDWGEVDDERIGVVTTVWLENPNPIGGGDADVEYAVALQGVNLAEGEGDGLSLPSGESTHQFRTDLFYDRLPAWWHAHLTNDEVSSVRVNATANVSAGPVSGSPSGSYEDSVDTDIEGALDRGFSSFEGSYSATGTDLRAPDGTALEPAVDVESVTTEWGEVTENQTEILVNASIHNPNAYPIPTPAFTGYLAMNEIRVADWNASEVEVLNVTEEGTIQPDTTEQRTFRVEMDNENVPEWFATHVDRGERSDVEVAGQFAFELSGNRVTIPQQEDGLSCSFDLTTAIFVDNQTTDMQFEECGATPLSIAQGELEAAGATLDITETDWWRDFGTDSDDDDDDDGLFSVGE